jgi:hypothetical protein
MRINQVLWVINSETKNVIPVKIVEKITKETSAGESTEFILESVSGKKMSLSSLKDAYFQSSQEAQQHLLSSAAKLIDEIIARAVKSSEKFFQDSRVHEEPSHDIVQEVDQPDFVMLPDGTRARLRIKDLEA